jgi:hypothetical protein
MHGARKRGAQIVCSGKIHYLTEIFRMEQVFLDRITERTGAKVVTLGVFLYIPFALILPFFHDLLVLGLALVWDGVWRNIITTI